MSWKNSAKSTCIVLSSGYGRVSRPGKARTNRLFPLELYGWKIGPLKSPTPILQTFKMRPATPPPHHTICFSGIFKHLPCIDLMPECWLEHLEQQFQPQATRTMDAWTMWNSLTTHQESQNHPTTSTRTRAQGPNSEFCFGPAKHPYFRFR